MNIAVISPGSNGAGVTALSILLGIAMKNKGLNAIVTSLADGANGMRDYCGKLVENVDADNGMSELDKLLGAGIVDANSIKNYTIDRGADILLRENGLSNKEVERAINGIASASVNGQETYVIVDVDINNMSDRAVGAEIVAADTVVIVIKQSMSYFRKFNENRESMTKHFAGKKVIIVVNEFEPFVGPIKDIWSKMDLAKAKGWFSVRYNKCVPLMTAKALGKNLMKAYKEADDPDVLQLKSDIDKIAVEVAKRR